MLTGNVLAQFSGSGSGTEEDPYRIFNAEQLNQVRNSPEAYFSLEADIDMTEWIAENNPSQGWKPISSFKGTFNGNGHRITNLIINRPTTSKIGLFSSISDANISNIEIVDTNYIGCNEIGGICGYISGGSITSCKFSGKIVGANYLGGIIGECWGSTSISNCMAIGSINGANYIGGIIGDAYETSNSDLQKCQTECNIVGNGYLGGIAGSIGYGHSVSESYSCSEIKWDSCIGGIVGFVDNEFIKSDYGIKWVKVYDNYSTETLEGIEKIGGIVGFCESKSYYGENQIYRCYSNCQKIYGTNYVGGIIGYYPAHYDKDSRSFNNYTYWKGNVSLNAKISSNINLYRIASYGYNVGSGGGANGDNYAWTLTKMILNDEVQPTPDDSKENGINTGLSALKLKATYQGLGWDFDETWNIQETECFPYLQMQTAPPYFTQTLKKGDTHLSGTCVEDGTIIVRVNGKTYTTTSAANSWSIDVDALQVGDDIRIMAQAEGKMPSYILTPTVAFDGDGTEVSPYLVTSAEELQNVTEDAYYKLANDIDLADWIANNNDGSGWIPVGGNGPASMAKLDGDGHTVSGLSCNASYENVGLFAKLNKDGEIKNMKIEIADNKSLSGTNAVGGLIGTNKGTIYNVSVKGNIGEGLYVGGIAGESIGTIYQCYTEGNVNTTTAAANAGGICGKSSGDVHDCYSAMTVTASGTNAYCAGIIGYNSGTVSKCYTSGHITGYVASGVVGYDYGASVSDCVALNKKINAVKSALRVLGGYSSDGTAPTMDNYALKTMAVSVNDVPQTIYDDPLNGTAKTETDLQAQDTYEVLGWDFTNVWKIDEGTSYPYQEMFNVPVTSIALDKTTATICINENLKLIATVLPSNARNASVTWSSSNENIATVSQNGTVTAIAEGKTVISARTNDGTNLATECIVTVEPASGISETQSDNIRIRICGNTIKIIGASENGNIVSVMTADGKSVYKGTRKTITVHASGIYIIKVNDIRRKIVVK